MLSASLQLLTSQVVVLLINVGFSMFLIRAMKTDEFALIAIYMILVQVASVVGAFGFEKTALRRVADLHGHGHDRAVSRYISTGLFVKSSTASLIGGSLFLFHSMVFKWFSLPSNLTRSFYLMIPALIFFPATDYLNNVVQSLKDFKFFSIFTAISDLLVKLIPVLGYVLVGVRGYWLAFSSINFILLIVLLYRVRKYIRFISIKLFRKSIRYSSPYFLLSVGRALAARGDDAVIGVAFTPELLVSYHIAKKIGSYLKIFFSTLITPNYVELLASRSKSEEARQKRFRVFLYIISFIFIPAICLMVVYAREILIVFAGSKYAANYFLLDVVLISVGIYFFADIFGMAVFALGSPLESMLCDGLYGFLTVGVLAGIAKFLPVNYTVASIIGVTAISLGFNFILASRHGISVRHEGPLGKVLLMSVLATVGALFCKRINFVLSFFVFGVYLFMLISSMRRDAEIVGFFKSLPFPDRFKRWIVRRERAA